MKKNIIVTILFWSVLLLSSLLQAESTLLWSETPLAQRAEGRTLFKLMPERYALYQLDEMGMGRHLNRASRSNKSSNTLSIPLPNKEMIELIVTETSVMATALAAKYPELKTYKVTVVGRPSVQGVVDFTELGFHGMLFMENGQRLFIDPRQSISGKTYYISYYDGDYHPANKKKAACQVGELSKTKQRSSIEQLSAINQRGTVLARSGANLRTYRLAMAVTDEYTQFHGGTKGKALSAIVTTVTRVNQIYERDLAIKLELVANNDAIIFTDNDPYTDNSDDTLLEENQAIVDDAIGSANYDIGHVMTRNEERSGVAYYQAACDSTIKAGGMTGHENPQNDPFDIDYIAHELGHQFGGSHSFNAVLDGCNRRAETAWEIGNGVTIMGYAGVCAPENNVQPNSIAMFHIGNIREMSQFIDDSSGGSSCGTVSNLSNQQPTANAGVDYTLPAETPFQLTGTGTDPNGSDILSYTWEQMDLGASANISEGDTGSNPLFRAFLPTHINSRTFPQLSDILSNTQTNGEILPTTSRSLKFAFTVRDQKGGIAEDEVDLTVIKTSAPFKITSHTTTTTLTASSSVDIRWNVAGTNIAPINCTAVNIALSIDGGHTFASVLAQNSTNDGSEVVTIPNTIATNTTSRFKVSCSNNIFFDISDVNLSITNTGSPNTSVSEFKEGNSAHVNYFKLAISSPLTVDASVQFETRDGSGKAADGDYLAVKGTVTIPAGETEKLIGVIILADSIKEPDETFSLVVTQPVNATFPSNLSELTATHTILNDD